MARNSNLFQPIDAKPTDVKKRTKKTRQGAAKKLDKRANI